MEYDSDNIRDELAKKYPDKFRSESEIFQHIHRGDRIFIHTGCGEPQYLINALISYLENNPKAFFDTEVLSWWTLGVAPYAKARYQMNFRHNSFFIGDPVRDSVNNCLSDYTPVLLSKVPQLFNKGLVPIDLALIQVSPPDEHGYVNLGISVDIVKAAVENASMVIAQINGFFPRIHGDGFIHIKDIDYLIYHDEPVLEYMGSRESRPEEKTIASKIGKYVSQLVSDGDTIQVGYGSIPDQVMEHLAGKKHLGVHTELLTDGLAKLISAGVIDNSRKTINRGKSIASFCMGSRDTYDFLDNNPVIEFKIIDYTNNPMIIAQHENMTAINSALQIDLTGQASAESLGKLFYSGIGGLADFMRGAILAKGGKTILALPSTAEGDTISRIVPFLPEGSGVTLNRGDIHYVVTEYGIAYLHGKNIRDRAMQLISIAHPSFRQMLIDQAKHSCLVFKDQAFVPGVKGEYPEHLEVIRTTKKNLEILIRPVKISDEQLVKDFFNQLSSQSLYQRFMEVKKYIPHEHLQKFYIIDYTKEMVLLANLNSPNQEKTIGMAQFSIDENSRMADIAFVVLDEFQKKGVATELFRYMIYLAKTSALLGFTAEVLPENTGMLYLFEKFFPSVEKTLKGSTYEVAMRF